MKNNQTKLHQKTNWKSEPKQYHTTKSLKNPIHNNNNKTWHCLCLCNKKENQTEGYTWNMGNKHVCKILWGVSYPVNAIAAYLVDFLLHEVCLCVFCFVFVFNVEQIWKMLGWGKETKTKVKQQYCFSVPH